MRASKSRAQPQPILIHAASHLVWRHIPALRFVPRLSKHRDSCRGWLTDTLLCPAAWYSCLWRMGFLRSLFSHRLPWHSLPCMSWLSEVCRWLACTSITYHCSPSYKTAIMHPPASPPHLGQLIDEERHSLRLKIINFYFFNGVKGFEIHPIHISRLAKGLETGVTFSRTRLKRVSTAKGTELQNVGLPLG
jgi:hypothetical protein